MGWIHAGNSESTSDGGAGYTRNASAVRDIVKHHDVDEKTAWALVALFSWQKSATIPDQVADSDYVSKWIDFPYFQAFLPVFQKYGWTSKVERFLESWIYHNQDFHQLMEKYFPEIAAPAPAPVQSEWVDYEALYEAKHNVNLRDKAENDENWYMNEVYPLSLKDWAKVQLEAVSF
jgi:hypothetical protein